MKIHFLSVCVLTFASFFVNAQDPCDTLHENYYTQITTNINGELLMCFYCTITSCTGASTTITLACSFIDMPDPGSPIDICAENYGYCQLHGWDCPGGLNYKNDTERQSTQIKRPPVRKPDDYPKN